MATENRKIKFVTNYSEGAYCVCDSETNEVLGSISMFDVEQEIIRPAIYNMQEEIVATVLMQLFPSSYTKYQVREKLTDLFNDNSTLSRKVDVDDFNRSKQDVYERLGMDDTRIQNLEKDVEGVKNIFNG